MGKKIDELSTYGSSDSDKAKGDIIEISKNSGTSGSPIYASDGSRKIRLDQLSSLIAPLIPGGYISLSGPNYLVVKNSGTAIDSGVNLLAAAAFGATATPNGSAKSASNRFSIILFPGIYDLNETDSLFLGKFIDIIGIGGTNDIVITSLDADGTIHIANDNDNVLENLTIKNDNDGNSITHADSITDVGIWNNLILYAPNKENTIFAGRYINIDGRIDGILNGSIHGLVDGCSFDNGSCGSSTTSAITISSTAIIKNSQGGDNCFGSAGGVGNHCNIDGELNNLIGGSYCFGSANLGESTGGNINISNTAFIKDCRAIDNSFGRSDGDININCKIINCSSGTESFGSSEFGNCTFDSDSYIESCHALDKSFCNGDGTEINGTVSNCIATTKSFGSTSSTGKIVDCKRTGGYGIHSGTIENCRFSENSGSTETINITDGTILRYSTFLQMGASDCINGPGGVTAEITYCFMNKELSAITNSAIIAYNIGDGFIPDSYILLSPNGHRQKVTVDNTSIVEAEDLDV